MTAPLYVASARMPDPYGPGGVVYPICVLASACDAWVVAAGVRRAFHVPTWVAEYQRPAHRHAPAPLTLEMGA